MRKDNRLKKRLKILPVKGVYAYFEVKGLNLNRFLESLKRNGIAVYNAKKTDNKRLVLAINAFDAEKLFAINFNVWYNTYEIRKIKTGGRNYPLFFLFKNVGIAVGIALFCATAYLSNDFIFSFSFTGSGSVYQREITEYLNENGITRFSRFSDIDLKTLEDSILSFSGNLSFVSCVKSGNRLLIDSAVSSGQTGRLSGKATELISDENGIIESVKVYRGTALKTNGEEIKKGETIVAGYADVKETRVSVNVIATATVIYFEDYEFTLTEDNDGAAAAFAKECAGKPCRDMGIFKTEKSGIFTYKVRLYFTKVLTVG